MGKSTVRIGKASECIVFGALLQEGIDVYPSLADDQGIDGVIRSKDGQFYWDLQIKSGSNWNGIRAWTDMATNRNFILLLFNSEAWEMIWLSPDKMRDLFPSTGGDWGDVFLDKKKVEDLKSKGFMDIPKLKSLIDKGWD